MSKKASDLVKYYQNENGPVIGTVHKNVICQDGLYFKDIDGSGVMKDYNDWRLPPKQRAESYVKQLSVKEKIGQLFIADWRMGIYQKDESKRDESGLLDEAPVVKGELGVCLIFPIAAIVASESRICFIVLLPSSLLVNIV